MLRLPLNLGLCQCACVRLARPGAPSQQLLEACKSLGFFCLFSSPSSCPAPLPPDTSRRAPPTRPRLPARPPAGPARPPRPIRRRAMLPEQGELARTWLVNTRAGRSSACVCVRAAFESACGVRAPVWMYIAIAGVGWIPAAFCCY